MSEYQFYGSCIGVILFCILHGKGLKVSTIFFPFLLAIPLSLSVNKVPDLFRAPLRAISFYSVILVAGPFLYNNTFVRFRRELFIYTFFLLRLIVLGSFIGYIFGWEFMQNRTGFCGLTNHSMILGPIAGIVTLNYLYWLYISTDDKSRILNGLKMVVSMSVVVLGGSRSAFGACLLGIAFFIVSFYKIRIMRLLKAGLIILAMVAVTAPVWWQFSERLRQKMDYSESMGSVTASRDALWTDRMDEFLHYPIFGVGFASYNLDIIKDEKYDKSSGVIEPGSSWLFLLSSMGLMGFLSFFLPTSYMLRKVYFLKTDRLKNCFLGSGLLFFMGHMLFEGYVVASGAIMCFLLWLFIGECHRYLFQSKY